MSNHDDITNLMMPLGYEIGGAITKPRNPIDKFDPRKYE